MVNRQLFDINNLKTEIILETNLKIQNNDVLSVNQDIDSILEINISQISVLLDTLERKVRDCEVLYYTFFENFDYDFLTDRSSVNSKNIEIQFNYDTKIIKKNYEYNDSKAYKDNIDSNFQTFILTLASLYENIGRLTEMFLKKIIIYPKKKNNNISSPYQLLLDYWEVLVSLEYRQRDNCYNSIDRHKTYLETYNKILSQLRNKFAHGYSLNLYNDGSDYRILNLDEHNFSTNGPHLIVNVFTEEVLTKTKALINDFLTALINDIKVPGQKIPM